ncbi:PLDc N-terminal domain-containing protein [Cryobacterium sp. W22_MBD10_FK3]|uniref:PLDc N-terminal domain-containing protein n=1 Tax=Cryobacterium sp. W22_MBD10_FK3 TaxID=3240273 RepID=UPI003F9329C7
MNSTLSAALQGTNEHTDVLDGGALSGAELGGLIGLALIVLALLGAIVLIVAALVQVAQAVHLSESSRTRWVLTVVFAPVFGALAWFAVGNRLQAG